MKKLPFARLVLGTMFVFAAFGGAANAQSTRTWVSSTGDDGFPCSRTAPCKTLAGAYAKTLPGGEISVVDAAGYGALTIGKAITINGEGTLASILASSGTAINVAAGANDRVVLRNLSINGAGGGNNGILISSGRVTIDHCFIYGFTTGFVGGVGVFVAGSGNTFVDVHDTNITNTTHGFLAQTSAGTISAVLDNVRINDAPGIGIGSLSTGVSVSVRNSLVKDAGSAAIYASTSGAVINVDHSELTNNTLAVNAIGGTVRLNDNSIYANGTDLAISGGGTIATANNNKGGGNGGGASPNGMITSF